MFSYRHAFHAGNHADVLKHAIYLHILDYYGRKEAPYTVIDTHAGAGLYDLDGEWAQTKGECEQGLDLVIEAERPPPMIARYLEAVAELNPDGNAHYYPGSPWLALTSMRAQDSFHGFELHPTEFPALNQNISQLFARPNRRVKTHNDDGFHGTSRFLPPVSRRGIVMMDPSYEAKSDYKKAIDSIEAALKRFAQCCFILWYPLVQRQEVKNLQRQLEKLQVSWLQASLQVKEPSSDGFGLHGSSMFIINPPWTLATELKTTLPWLKTTLAQDDKATFRLKEHQG
ncbi:23S rRNA (adenine(2030)-N(6))-methyltransferase RlmJ [Paenalcaligenes niemegkensis]|uniref:23S rRNA (adenine(2030)-N(6))-methyltransferase RlmJ n=1 Tax=Paenalcaligenes niemegkensis TaxID=2895469 RepID=UPI001EE89F5F|nr:23S rRNA (adenine(2030)-N(6))-methyltransferase RlmJ [Paenalcaligenes niemegkensis]MCQ9616252.1 23S rRNA (adenine(2030)-N(6))-methyltransferase RlmJ [Paenalcaligenes niemegkensis]